MLSSSNQISRYHVDRADCFSHGYDWGTSQLLQIMATCGVFLHVLSPMNVASYKEFKPSMKRSLRTHSYFDETYRLEKKCYSFLSNISRLKG